MSVKAPVQLLSNCIWHIDGSSESVPFTRTEPFETHLGSKSGVKPNAGRVIFRCLPIPCRQCSAMCPYQSERTGDFQEERKGQGQLSNTSEFPRSALLPMSDSNHCRVHYLSFIVSSVTPSGSQLSCDRIGLTHQR